MRSMNLLITPKETCMEMIGKVVRGICSIPIIGGYLALIVGILPLIIVIPFIDGPYKYLVTAVAGLLIAAWCFFLSKKKIINIVTPLLPIPFWVFGILISIFAVYQHIFGPIQS